MKTNILYVLVSNEKDIFWEQTFISIHSLLRTNGSVNISILMDDKTRQSLKGKREDLLKLITEPIVVELEESLSNKEKSRILKTNMRNYVEGDFLFIDSDTIILDDLSEIDMCEYDLAAVYERNRKFKEDHGRINHIETTRRLGDALNDNDEYFNSGVMLVKDTPTNRSFFKSWNDRWREGVTQNVYFDQPSLGCVNKEYGNIIRELDGKWNCQGRFCFCYIRDSKIFHYMYDKFFDFPLLNKDYLKAHSVISEEIEAIIRNPINYVTPVNEVITGEEVKRIHSRMFALIRAIDVKAPSLYSMIEKTLDCLYSLFLKLKKRKLAPPR